MATRGLKGQWLLLQDLFGRIEGQHAITGSNLFKVGFYVLHMMGRLS